MTPTDELPTSDPGNSEAESGREQQIVRPGYLSECAHCGRFVPEDQVNFVESGGNDHEVCNSCYFNAGY